MGCATVSIVVPIYNTETYLRKCIDSLLNQTYRSIEIILVNDGSTDSSLQICREYQNKYNNIKIIDQPNKGVSSARNAGILASKGKYITFVDSDDSFLSDAIQIMCDLIEDYNVDIVSASMCSENNSYSLVEPVTYHILDSDNVVLWGIKEVSLSVCAKLFTKRAIEGIFFDETRKINEDGFFIFECCMRRLKILDCSQIVYIYNERPNSSSRAPFSDKYLDMLYFVEKKKKIISEYYPDFISEMITLEVKTTLNLLHKLCSTNEKKYNSIKKNCCKLIRQNPFIEKKALLKYQRRLRLFVIFGFFWLYQVIIRRRSQR